VSRYVGAYTCSKRSAIRCCGYLSCSKLDMGRGEDPESSQAGPRVGEDGHVGAPVLRQVRPPVRPQPGKRSAATRVM